MVRNRIFWVIIFWAISFGNLKAQETDTIIEKSKKNLIRLDLGGRGFIYSICYDRIFDLKYLDFHTVVGLGDLSPWSISYNTSIYFTPKLFKINPIFGFSHVKLYHKIYLPVPIGIVFTGLDYNKLRRWNFQLIFNKMYYFYDKNNTQFLGGFSLGYKF